MLSVVRDHAASMLKLARAHSLCADDAHDAYQRAIVIYLERADRIDHATVGSYLRTVVKNEAIDIRTSRMRGLSPELVDLDDWRADVDEPHERAEAFDRVARAAEALRGCKHDEAVALLLRAEGSTYEEIARRTGWSRTKVNRCLTEGRARFRAGLAEIDSGGACERWAPVLVAVVDGRARAPEVIGARDHLRRCASCRLALREIYEAPRAAAALFPAGFAAGLREEPGSMARAWEAVHGPLADKAMAFTLKLQATVEAVAGGKVAAVAASAAALAGGGVAVERIVEPPRQGAVAGSEARKADSGSERWLVRGGRHAGAGRGPGKTGVPSTAAPAAVASGAARRVGDSRPASHGRSSKRRSGESPGRWSATAPAAAVRFARRRPAAAEFGAAERASAAPATTARARATSAEFGPES